MCIYCTTTNYRKIYENHYGPVPVDEDGKSFDIHHIDGNHSNNNPKNLKAVTVKEHYDLHYSQGDYVACWLIATQRLNLTKEELYEINRKQNLDRLANGTHNWTTEYLQKFNKDRIENGTHPFIGSSINEQMIKDGTHSSLTEWKCEFCGKEGKGKGNFTKYHGKECLQNPANKHKKRKPNNFTTDNPNSNHKWTCPECNMDGKGIFNFKHHVGSKKCIKNQHK